MANEQYTQLGWSPDLYAFVLAGMALFTLVVMGGCVAMMVRASQATAPAPEPAEPAAELATPAIDQVAEAVRPAVIATAPSGQLVGTAH